MKEIFALQNAQRVLFDFYHGVKFDDQKKHQEIKLEHPVYDRVFEEVFAEVAASFASNPSVDMEVFETEEGFKVECYGLYELNEHGERVSSIFFYLK